MNGADRSLIRAIRGPVTLITVGVLFALNNFTPYGFERTWPVLLIVFGLLSLLRRGTEPPRAVVPGPAFSPYTYPPPPGGYPQSSYSTPPAAGGTGRPGDSAPPPPAGGSQ
jgi:hypothetical protein